MKKLLMLMLAAGLLAACSNKADEVDKSQLKSAEKELEQSKENTKRLEELTEEMGISEEEPAVESAGVSAADVAELIADEALGEGDTITNVEIYDGEIKAVVEVSDDSVISDKSLIAETIYSRAGDSLLEHEGWETLTIEFVDVGTISMQRDERETNEYGMDYFPLEKIIGQLE